MSGKYYITITLYDLFEEVKRFTELKTRLNDEVTDRIVATDSDAETFVIFYRDFIAEFKNEVGAIGQIIDEEQELVYSLNKDEYESGLSELTHLLQQIAVTYLLWRWYESVGAHAYHEEYYAKWQKLIRDWRTNASKPGFVKPKYRPYW